MINPLRAGFKNHTKSQSSKLKSQADPTGIIMWLSSVYGPQRSACNSKKCLLMRQRVLSRWSPRSGHQRVLVQSVALLVALDALIQNISEVLNRIQVSGTWGPVIQELLTYSGYTGHSIALHQEEPSARCVSTGSDSRSKDLYCWWVHGDHVLHCQTYYAWMRAGMSPHSFTSVTCTLWEPAPICMSHYDWPSYHHPWSLFLTVWSQTCTIVAHWRSFVGSSPIGSCIREFKSHREQACHTTWVHCILFYCSDLSF